MPDSRWQSLPTIYNETHDAGKLYWHTMRVPRSAPVFQRDGTTHEVARPWRVGRSWVLRVLSLALVVGWWGPHRSDEEMLAAEADRAEDSYLPTIEPDEIRNHFREQPDGETTNDSPYDVKQWQE